jgi:hypothetical protein
VHAVGSHHGLRGVAALAVFQSGFTAGKDDARGQAFYVPLPRASQSFVKIVDVKNDAAFGRAVTAEIQQVAIAAELGVQAGDRSGGEIGGHDGSGAAEKRERRFAHSSVTNREQALDSPFVRLSQ